MYVGNINLKPETAHTLSYDRHAVHDGASSRTAAAKDWELKITPYYTYVEDYIDVEQMCSPGHHHTAHHHGGVYEG